MPEGDEAEIGRRVEALEAEMKPRSSMGAILIVQMATLSVRAERATKQESAAIALRARHAADDFDEERIERADALFDGLADDPRNTMRKLRKMPEGVDRLIEGWRDLRADLTHAPSPLWSVDHGTRAARLLGVKEAHVRGSRLDALGRAVLGDCRGLEAVDGAGLDHEGRRAWSKARLVERIDAEVAALEAHRETLDFETLELDRAEAGSRALFDTSKGATLARRYESEARRGFSKALKEFRLVEAEAAARAEAPPAPSAAPPTAPEAPRPEAKVGSSREIPPPVDRIPSRPIPAAPSSVYPTLVGPDGQPLPCVPPAQPLG